MSEEQFIGFCKGNVMKYLWRFEHKGNPLADLQKAADYLEWLRKAVDRREWKGQKMETDSYLYDSYRIWGLSLMMIDEMIGMLNP